jgi:hypothetical protein
MDGYSAVVMSDLVKNSTAETLRLRSVSGVFGFPKGAKTLDNKTMDQLIKGYKTILLDMFANVEWVGLVGSQCSN